MFILELFTFCQNTRYKTFWESNNGLEIGHYYNWCFNSTKISVIFIGLKNVKCTQKYCQMYDTVVLNKSICNN